MQECGQIDYNEKKREGFVKGYHQARQDLREEVASCKVKNWNDGFNDGYKKAEKDLALTVEDVLKLINIWIDLPDSEYRTLVQIAEETLHRFNNLKK